MTSPAPLAEPTEPTALPPGEERLAEIRVLVPVSVVVPTYRERENLPHLVARLDALRRTHGLDLELLVMDDPSGDGTEAWARDHAPPWVRLVLRSGRRGLSPAVVDGLREARHPVIVVMDADLSHPPEKIPHMVLALESGQELVIGSRYVPGGSTDDDWGFFRWLNSRVATLLARPLTDVRDPMAGFFALRRRDLVRARSLNPIGYKIALELIVKCGFENVGEVPIHFRDRVHGESKLTLREQLNYLRHLGRLYRFKLAHATGLAQFALVGASGVAVNLGVLTGLAGAGAGAGAALAGGIAASVLSNFGASRLLPFGAGGAAVGDPRGRSGGLGLQLVRFVLASSVGALVQLGVALAVHARAPSLPLQLAALGGIAAGMLVNFTVNRYFVFKTKHPARP